MQGNKSKNTKPEILVRSMLHKLGFRFRLNRKDLPGKPDIVLPRFRLCLFVHGCFWHTHENCKLSNTPKTRTEYWNRKLSNNKERDAKAMTALLASGWNVFVIWECETKSTENLEMVIKKIMSKTMEN